MRLIVLPLLLLGLHPAAHAYIGPGLGAGAIGVILGLLASLFLALFALFWYPVKRLLKKRRTARAAATQNGEAGGDGQLAANKSPGA